VQRLARRPLFVAGAGGMKTVVVQKPFRCGFGRKPDPRPQPVECRRHRLGPHEVLVPDEHEVVPVASPLDQLAGQRPDLAVLGERSLGKAGIPLSRRHDLDPVPHEISDLDAGEEPAQVVCPCR
jgi:hypothetical protein